MAMQTKSSSRLKPACFPDFILSGLLLLKVAVGSVRLVVVFTKSQLAECFPVRGVNPQLGYFPLVICPVAYPLAQFETGDLQRHLEVAGSSGGFADGTFEITRVVDATTVETAAGTLRDFDFTPGATVRRWRLPVTERACLGTSPSTRYSR